jgi:hypothetical protein
MESPSWPSPYQETARIMKLMSLAIAITLWLFNIALENG